MNYVLLLRRITESPITQAEEIVAVLLLQGLNRVEIAQQLNVSPNTVRNQMNSIYSKCKVAGRPELIAKALRFLLQEVAA